MYPSVLSTSLARQWPSGLTTGLGRHIGTRFKFAALALLTTGLLTTGLLAACGGGGGGGSPVQPPAAQSLQVSVNGSGRVLSQPAGIDCGSSCSSSFEAGSVTLTATPAAGQVFSGWGGECTGTASTCTVTIATTPVAQRTVTASFVPVPATTATLTLSTTGNGSVTSLPAGVNCGSTCTASFALNTAVTLTATPAAGQVFSAWGGACTGAGLSCNVSMSEARSVTALFAPAPAVLRALSITLSGSGSVRSAPVGIDCGSTCTANFGDGSTVLLTAAAAAGQRFTGWSGACTGSDATCSVTMSQARSVTASFAAASAAPLWGAAELLETNNDFNVSTRVLSAMAPNGNALVMWEQSDGTPTGDTRRVYSRRYVAGQGWDAAVLVPGASTSSSAVALVEGRLLMDAAGNATWLRPNVETRRYNASTGWGSAFLPPLNNGGLLSAAVIDAAGNIRVLISGSDVVTNTLAASSSSWGTWVPLNTSSLTANNAELAVSSNGSALAIWRERNPGDSNFSMMAARFTVATGWQAPQAIDNSFNNVNADSRPRVAIDATGNGIAVWHQGNSLWTNVYSAASGWGTAAEVDVNAVSSTFSAFINVAMNEAGRAVVTWKSGIFSVKSMQYTPGAGFAPPILANSYGNDSRLGIDGDGNAALVYVSVDRWPNPTSATFNAYARRLPWGGSWSDAVLLESGVGDVGQLSAAFNSAGQGLAAWVQGDTADRGTRQSLRANLLR